MSSPSVLPKQGNTRAPSALYPADNPIRTIEYAMQELISSGAQASDVANSGAYLSNDTALITAIQASLAART